MKSIGIKSQELDSKYSKYYNGLPDSNYEQNKLHRKNILFSSTKTMDIRYNDMIHVMKGIV